MSHRENTLNAVENTPPILPVFPDDEKVSDTLKGVDELEEANGYFVPFEKAQSVRAVITQINTYTDKKFTSRRVPVRDGYPFGGINIWREA